MPIGKKVGRRVAVLLLDRSVQRLSTEEDASQRVVILRRDRVELVIMTSCAGDGHRQRRFEDDVDLVVGDVHLKLCARRVVAFGTEREHAGRDPPSLGRRRCFLFLALAISRLRSVREEKGRTVCRH